MASGDGEFSRIFVLKVTLHSVRLLLIVIYTKNGEQDVLVVPPIILLGEQLLPGSHTCGFVCCF